jgi:predicted transcriptional regulator
MTENTSSKATFVRLTPDIDAALREKAAREDRTIAGIIRLALRAYLGLDEDDDGQ